MGGRGDRLQAGHLADVPVRELSGVCTMLGAGGEVLLAAVGDRAGVVAWAALPAGAPPADGAWRTTSLAGVSGSAIPAADPQVEAVCADALGRVLLLQERPPRAELIDAAARRVVAAIELHVPAGHALHGAWADPAGSGGEGAVLLPHGHLLVAKEKDPPALIEFGPDGAASLGLPHPVAAMPGGWPASGDLRYVPLAVWHPGPRLREACRDLSDLDVGPDGRLYALSDRSAAVARIGPLPPGGGEAEAEAAWRLPVLDGKPEGLAFTAAGHAVVGLDRGKARRNLAVTAPPVAPPRAAGP